MDGFDTVNAFVREHPQAAFWIAVGLIGLASALLLRLDRHRPDYEFPESPDAERHAELTRYLERHQPTPRRTHSLDDVRFSGVKVCCCGRLVDGRAKEYPHGVSPTRTR